ncbi:hypothetical protein Droror1_Dr00024353, partial [Drosera rotundifolia]
SRGDQDTFFSETVDNITGVYVIAKGKVISVRSAQRPLANTAAPPKLTASYGLPHQLSANHASLDGGARSTGFPAGLQATGSERYYLERGIDSVRGLLRPRPYSGSRKCPTNMSLENIDIVSRPCGSSAHCSFSDEENEDQLGSRSMDMTAQNLDFSIPGSGKIPGNPNDVEAEMRRLHLELKQTMDMYSTACKEGF